MNPLIHQLVLAPVVQQVLLFQILPDKVRECHPFRFGKTVFSLFCDNGFHEECVIATEDTHALNTLFVLNTSRILKNTVLLLLQKTLLKRLLCLFATDGDDFFRFVVVKATVATHLDIDKHVGFHQLGHEDGVLTDHQGTHARQHRIMVEVEVVGDQLVEYLL